jgi:transcription antitermination protein NusB
LETSPSDSEASEPRSPTADGYRGDDESDDDGPTLIDAPLRATNRRSGSDNVDTRHHARERALGLLYEADMKGEDATAVVEHLRVAPDPFVAGLIHRVCATEVQANRLIEAASVGWPMDRMAVVDRLVLRLATAELLDNDGAPVAVVIDEAVELAKTYSTEESGRFVNGILSTIATDVRP